MKNPDFFTQPVDTESLHPLYIAAYTAGDYIMAAEMGIVLPTLPLPAARNEQAVQSQE